MGSPQIPRPVSPEDRWPRVRAEMFEESDAVRYELFVRLDPRTWPFNPRQTLVIRLLREVDENGVEVIVVAPKKGR
jgi:hypothetical protein